MKMVVLLILIMIVRLIQGALYDTFTGEIITPQREADVRRLNQIPWCAIDVADCKPDERRRMDYSCNNPRYPPRGATLTPYFHLVRPKFGRNYTARQAKDGADLPNVRDIRVSIISDGRRSSEHYTQLMTHVGVFITGDVTSLHDTVNYAVFTRDCCKPSAEQDPRCLPIRVANDDVHLRRSNVRCLNLTTPISYQSLGCAPRNMPPSRINTSPPMLDLSIMYGNSELDMRRGKAGIGGRIQTELLKGKEWPPSGTPLCFLNRPELGETRCHNSANPGINTILGTNLYGLWFIRNHNQIARRLEELNPCWNDDQLFAEAREVNIAMWQQMLYYELWPSLMGYEFLLKQGVTYNTFGHVNDYDERLEPRLSIEFVMAYRWFHTMQEGRLRFYDNKGRLIDERDIVDFTLRTGALTLNNTIEGITQGSFRQPSADADHVVDPDIGERILGNLQFASDVVSSDIMKGRALGLPPYLEYRRFCGLPGAKDFDDLRLWMKEEQVLALQMSYRDVDDIDLAAGMIAEPAMPGAVVGPTLACILVHQLKGWRISDRFWYENSVHPGSFTPEQLYEIRKFRMSRLLCDHGETVDSVQPYSFLVPGPGNEIGPCSEIPVVNMALWKDNACAKDRDTDGRRGDGYFSQLGQYVQNMFRGLEVN